MAVELLDGGCGEELFKRGVPDDRQIWSATAVKNPHYHGILKQIHRDFISSGSAKITACNFSITPGVGFSAQDVRILTALAGRLAKEARDSMPDAAQHVEVLGSLPPLLESYRADKIMTRSAGVEWYSIIASALSDSVDALIAETLSSREEMFQATFAAFRTTNLPLYASWTLGGDGKLRSGESVSSSITDLLNFIEDECKEDPRQRLRGVLFNCCEPESISKALQELQDNADLLSVLREKGIKLGAYANALAPVSEGWELATSDAPQPMRDDLNPRQYGNFVLQWVKEFGLELVGGCCGIGPDHIAALRDVLRKEGMLASAGR